MRKEEFLRELEALLQIISESERREALQYYRDYFDDAGPENEEEIIRELGSPQKVAATIQAGLGENDGEFSERGYRDNRFTSSQELGPRTADPGAGRGQEPGNSRAQQKNDSGWKIVSIILLCLLLSPVILPLGLALVGVIVGILGAVLGILIAVGVVAFVIPVVGIVMIVAGFSRIFLLPAVGMAMAGVGFLMLAAGMLVLIAGGWLCVKVFPWLIRGIVGLFSYPFRKRKEAAQR